MLLLSEHLMIERGKKITQLSACYMSMRIWVQISGTCERSHVMWFMTVVPALDGEGQEISLGLAGQPAQHHI